MRQFHAVELDLQNGPTSSPEGLLCRVTATDVATKCKQKQTTFSKCDAGSRTEKRPALRAAHREVEILAGETGSDKKWQPPNKTLEDNLKR